MTYIDKFLGQVRKTPDAVAVRDEFRELTYSELEQKTASLAKYLYARGFKVGDVVGVLLPRTLDIVVASLCVMRAGGVYMPMDMSYPQERLQYMCEDSGCRIVLEAKDLEHLEHLEHLENPVRPITLDSPAFLLYTSGTTGKPKGVLHSHRSLLAMAQQKHQTALNATGVVAVFTFIASVHMMFPPLLVGGFCDIAPDSAKADMNLLHEYISTHNIRQIFLPASLAATMAEEFPLDGVTIFSAGEKLRNFRPKGDSRIINSYGSTEGVTVLGGIAYGNEIDIPLGKPLGGITTRLVDENLNDVANGEAGELIYTGDIMATCYLNLDEQTRAKWINIEGTRWYRTGDRMFVDADGMYHYLGRTDNLVKIRGFRVETGEVENAIRVAAPEIQDVVVVLRSVHGIDHLCAYYTLKQRGESLEQREERVKEEIGKTLTSYMIPDAWTYLDEFPRNPNGKIIRGSLPEPQQHLEALSALYSEVELRVEEAARTILGLDTPVDIDESFLSLGGDSLRAMKLSQMLSAQGIRVTGSQILRLKILRQIAEEADVAYERLWTPQQYTNVRNRFAQWGERIEKVLPLTPEQDDMLYSELFYPDVSDTRTVYVLAIDSNITEEELKKAVTQSCKDNEELRAAVIYQGVSVFQQVITNRTIPCRCIDLSCSEDSYVQIAQICEQLKREPIDLEQSPAMEVVAVKTVTGTCLLVKTLQVSLGLNGVRKGIVSILKALATEHPEDQSIRDWIELMPEESSSSSNGSSGSRVQGNSNLSTLHSNLSPIAIYSNNPGKKKVVFVHTGNTGSDAYYALADRIGDKCSFAVIEPYNLYHPNDAIDGIPAIAAKYVEILRQYQPEGPYILGGWCYGGVVAHEMACQLQAQGETVEQLIMLDSHAVVADADKKLFTGYASQTKRDYFETSPLFSDLRNQGLLESIIANAKRVSRNLAAHTPSRFIGPVLYFKPQVTPAGMTGESLLYSQQMMQHKAGGYEKFCTDIRVIMTPHEHDLMMDDESLAIIVPELEPIIKN